MVRITIKIVSEKINDNYPRVHGLSVDEPLDRKFWSTQPEKVIGTSSGNFSYEKSISLDPGRHNITYGISAYAGSWNASIYANGLLLASGEITLSTDPYKFLEASFLIGPMGNVAPIKVPILNKGFVLPKIQPIFSQNRGILARIKSKFRRN